MTPEKEDQLCKDFPILYKDRFEDPKNSLMIFGVECEDGWYDLIYKLSSDLTALNENIVATQVKQKYGTLRFYITSGSDAAYDLIDKAEQLSATVCEKCGSPCGQLIPGGWIYTLCKECNNAKQNKKSN